MTKRLVFLHGFTQTHHHWHAVAHRLAAAIPTEPTLAFVDLPGHGLSQADTTALDDTPRPLAELAGPGTWIGYSMGARHALLAACEQAPEVQQLVLIGGTAGIADQVERELRGDQDAARATRLETIGVEAFIDEWMALPMFAGLAPDPDDRRHRLRNSTAGLAFSLRRSGTGAQRSVWDRLGEVQIPVLVLAGERDPKFVEIGQRLAEAMPRATFDAIPDAGHAAHNEQPQASVELIGAWLDRWAVTARP